MRSETDKKSHSAPKSPPSSFQPPALAGDAPPSPRPRSQPLEQMGLAPPDGPAFPNSNLPGPPHYAARHDTTSVRPLPLAPRPPSPKTLGQFFAKQTQLTGNFLLSAPWGERLISPERDPFCGESQEVGLPFRAAPYSHRAVLLRIEVPHFKTQKTLISNANQFYYQQVTDRCRV